MAWNDIAKYVIFLFITAAIVTVFVFIGTGKYKSDSDIDKEIGYVFGFTALITVAIFFINHLNINSINKSTLTIYWVMTYLSLFMAYITMGIIGLSPRSSGASSSSSPSSPPPVAGGTGGSPPGTPPCCGTTR
jgi:hypothetical protein